jgi:hypothetical protein
MGDADTKKCSNCSRNPQPLSEFVGKFGPAKTCKSCRDKGKKSDTVRREDPEKREEKNARGRDMKYYQAYRERKREEDFEGYRANINEVRKDWYEENKEHMRDWSKKNVNSRLDASKRSADKRGYDWYLSDEYAKELMTSECHYCGLLDLGVRVNGIDRVDNTLGYWPSNTVSCCKLCNYFKKDYTLEQFLGHAKRITEYQCTR